MLINKFDAQRKPNEMVDKKHPRPKYVSLSSKGEPERKKKVLLHKNDDDIFYVFLKRKSDMKSMETCIRNRATNSACNER